MSRFNRPPVRRTRSGRYALALGPDERAMLASLPAQMQSALAEPGSPSLRRLFPPAYAAPGDQEHQAEYHRLMGGDLLASHRDALAVLAETAHADELSAGQLDAWVRALNQARLLLGTQLDVSEADDPAASGEPMSPQLGLYHYLGYLQQTAVDALADGS